MAVAYDNVKIWDDVSKDYEAAFGNMPEQDASLDWLLSQLKPKSNILEVGCGTGSPAAFRLAEAGHDVLGIDISPQMLELARKAVPGAKFELVDTRKYEAEAGTFDAITLYFSFISGVTQDDVRALFPRLYRWLRTGGILIFATAPIESNLMSIKWMGMDVMVSSLSTEETMSCIRKAGFSVEQERSSTFLPKLTGKLTREDVWEEPHLFVYARKT